MPNVTMSFDDSLLKKARRIAVDKDTTLTELIRSYLQELVEREEVTKEFAIAELETLFERSKASVGSKRWTRDELHERR